MNGLINHVENFGGDGVKIVCAIEGRTLPDINGCAVLFSDGSIGTVFDGSVDQTSGTFICSVTPYDDGDHIQDAAIEGAKVIVIEKSPYAWI